MAKSHHVGDTAMTKPAELYACIYAKEFPAQAMLRLRPELQPEPCVVMDGEPPLQYVCSRNARAHILGVAHGMTPVEIDTFPSVATLLRSRTEEKAAKAAILECAGIFSPRVEDHSNDHALVCVVDIAGTEKLFGPPLMLAKGLRQRLKALGITASVAVSANAHAATCLARGRSSRTDVAVIAAGEESVALAPLPLAVLDLSDKHRETFSLWGIQTLGMLANLPEKALIARMGQEGKRLRQSARGEVPHLFLPIEPEFALEERMELDTPVELLDSLLFVVGVMLEQLIVRATVRILALASVTITLALEGGASHARSVRPALPSNDRQLWIKLIHLDLEAHPPQAAILSLALSAEPGDMSKVQLGLFSPQLPEPARLDVTLARIRALVGENGVGRAVLKDTHQPDEFGMEPFTVPTGPEVAVAQTLERAAMRQLRPAEPLTVLIQESRPSTFYFREKRYAVEHAYGPWLASGEWWGAMTWQVQKWDLVARSQDGASLCCHIAYERKSGCWQMVGLYD
jgi:protein ImuB